MACSSYKQKLQHDQKEQSYRYTATRTETLTPQGPDTQETTGSSVHKVSLSEDAGNTGRHALHHQNTQKKNHQIQGWYNKYV